MTPNSDTQRLAEIRAKCVEANPEIARGEWNHDEELWIAREPRLADLLLAVHEHFRPRPEEKGELVAALAEQLFWQQAIEVLKCYDLRQDSLDLQDAPTLQLLHKLLCPSE